MEIWPSEANIVEILADLGIDTTSWVASSYTKLKKEILRAQREFEGATRRKYEQATIAEKYNGNGKATLVLRQYPIVSVTSIKFLTYSVLDYVLTISDFETDNEYGILKVITTFPSSTTFFPVGRRNIEVCYTYGYAVGSIPDDIKDCIIMMALMRVISRSPAEWEGAGLKGFSIGNYSEQYGAGEYYGGIFGAQRKEWAAKIADIIKDYKRIPK